MTYASSWSSRDLAIHLCDDLVANGQLKEKPAFIRADREDLLAESFAKMGLDGEKMASFTDTGPLEMMVRKGTSGQAWVDPVIASLKAMLPRDVIQAPMTLGLDEETQHELEEAHHRTLVKREFKSHQKGGSGGRFERGGKGDRQQECYNCGGSGHISRECPEMRRGKGRGEDKARASEAECFNCGRLGHFSRDCPEPHESRKGKGGG
eukprot:TRINITY_DN36602_c0_g1_i1.p1 TRINITY_DN36602_c0_g1~~TRINITY_DN36602_c0_g1_i1.p1  ORF type:complete len:235 (-),score=46.78 TRINITY_DN36602_c0_g1_i1:56-679(-)